MNNNSTYIVTPGGFALREDGIFIASGDPLTQCLNEACDGDSLQLVPGEFPRARGPWGGKRSIKISGWDRQLGVSIIKRDELVGSSDSFILGPGDGNFILEDLNIEADDRAGVKTTAGVGKPNDLIGVNIYGKGSPHDPLWSDTSKWGGHFYETAGWNEVRCNTWSIFNEHGRYFHNPQGIHNFQGGLNGYFGGCDIFFASRQNEGPVGKGDVNIVDRYVEDGCVGQGGSLYTFRGGVPGGNITLRNVKARLGCKASLAAPWNQNICGVLSVDSADETAPGKADAAWPGNYASVTLDDCDFEVGTVWPGRTGMIRPVVTVGACDLFKMVDTRIKVTRAPGAYPIALSIPTTCKAVQFTGHNDIEGWVEYHGSRFTSFDLFRGAHPEAFA